MAALLALGVVAAAPAAAGATVFSAHEVLARWTIEAGDALYFTSPEGPRWELITDINDPEIGNRGEGRFFPVETEHVERALAAIEFPIEAMQFDVVVLPFPRRGLLPSSAGRRTIYLSPGVVPVSEERVHALVAHELGHLVHRAFLPDEDGAGWIRYRSVRSIEDSRIYHHGAAHRDRPREILAEDFRFLFGGALANYAGGIENPDLPLPDRVDGLEAFFLELPERDPSAPRPVRPLKLSPNPSPGGRVALTFSSDASVPTGPLTLSVFDLAGRLVDRRPIDGGNAPTWDGVTAHGTAARSGVYFLRVTGDGASWAGKLLIAR